jgi:hypothetical protein
MNLQRFNLFLEFLFNRDTFLTGPNPTRSHWRVGPQDMSAATRQWPVKLFDWARLVDGDRRRRSSSGSWGDLRTPPEPGHHEKLIGINPATKWSSELTQVNPSTAVHGGHTSILSYGAWNDSKIIWEGAYAHPEADANLSDVGDGRRWVNLHGFRRATRKGNSEILPTEASSSRFLYPWWSNRNGPPPQQHRGARRGPHRRFTGELLAAVTVVCER